MKLFNWFTSKQEVKEEVKQNIIKRYKVIVTIYHDNGIKKVDTIETDEETMLAIYNKLKNLPRKDGDIFYPKKKRF